MQHCQGLLGLLGEGLWGVALGAELSPLGVNGPLRQERMTA